MFKNKKIKIALIAAATVLALSVTAFSKTISQRAEIFYNNIKIYINGAEIVPKDAKGNTVEPFIMDGTTYLPVRAIANAFGEDVEWDGTTQSVYIGKADRSKPDNYLDRIQYTDFSKANSDCALFRINGTVTDYLGKTYTKGMIFKASGRNSVSGNMIYSYIEEDNDNVQLIIDYPLNSQYKKLSGNVVLPQSIDSTGLEKAGNYNQKNHEVYVLFYGDGKLLKEINAVTKTMPFSFDIDVTGVNMLTIKIKDAYDGKWEEPYIALTDLALYK